jgi:DNA-binding MarR family transcriptional regulator
MTEGDRFAELLARVAREVTIRQSSEICCGDLTLEQFQTLTAVSASDQLSIGSLSAQLRVDVSTMSRNVALLERNGYVLRARSAEDGRIVHVAMTAKGKRALHTLRCGERDVLGDVFDRLPLAQRPRVLAALESLSACLTDAKAAAGPDCCATIAIRRTTPP